MKNLTLILILLTAFAASAQNTETPVQHAASTVAHLHDTMLDPASFVLDGVFVTKANKRGNVSMCYAFRSHNTMGGYAEDDLPVNFTPLSKGLGRREARA